MAESPTSEPAALAASRLTLAPVPPLSPLRPWVPALASLAVNLGQMQSAGVAPGEPGSDDEAGAYLRALTAGDHGLSYVSVDELVGAVVGLAVDPWPGIDDRGRLVFAGSAVVDSLEVELGLLQEFVNEHRQWSAARNICPPELVGEPVRIGDVYGMRVTVASARLRTARLERSGPLATLRVPSEHGAGVVELAGLNFGTTHGAVADLGFDARELSRTAYYAAMATELDPRRRADRAIVQAASASALDRLGKALEAGD
jgi:hypothetical protein